MTLNRLLIIFVVVCLSSTFFGQNAELRTLKDEDQAVRLDPNSKITRTDEERGKLVLELLAKGAAQTPEDKFNAAIVLQHTPLDFCGKHMVSKSPDNYLLAHYLAKQSYEAGYKDARTLVAQTIDRYLTFTQGYQKYGTNRIFNQKTGKEELVRIDRSVSDSERATYGVPSLSQLLSAYPEQSAPTTGPEKSSSK